MSPLWVLPAVVVAVGTAALALATRRLLAATQAAATAVEHLRLLTDEVAALHTDAVGVGRRGVDVVDLHRRANPTREAR